MTGTTTGARIEEARRKAGRSRGWLAARVRTTESTIYRIETGRGRTVTLALGLRIARACDVDPATLVPADDLRLAVLS